MNFNGSNINMAFKIDNKESSLTIEKQKSIMESYVKKIPENIKKILILPP